jgi:hypothetical protein
MLQELLELPLILIPVNPDVYAVAIGLVVLPLADVAVAFGAGPHAVAVDQAVLEVADVTLFARVGEGAAAVGFGVYEVACVGGSGGEFQVALAHFEVEFEGALIDGIACH